MELTSAYCLFLITEIDSSPVSTGESLQRTDTCIYRSPTQRMINVISSTGDVVTEKNIKLVFPPGAEENPVSVSISLEDPSRYCGLIVQNSLENDVIFGAPVIRLQPDGLLFKKSVTLTVKFSSYRNIPSSEIPNFTPGARISSKCAPHHMKNGKPLKEYISLTTLK